MPSNSTQRSRAATVLSGPRGSASLVTSPSNEGFKKSSLKSPDSGGRASKAMPTAGDEADEEEFPMRRQGTSTSFTAMTPTSATSASFSSVQHHYPSSSVSFAAMPSDAKSYSYDSKGAKPEPVPLQQEASATTLLRANTTSSSGFSASSQSSAAALLAVASHHHHRHEGRSKELETEVDRLRRAIDLLERQGEESKSAVDGEDSWHLAAEEDEYQPMDSPPGLGGPSSSTHVKAIDVCDDSSISFAQLGSPPRHNASKISRDDTPHDAAAHDVPQVPSFREFDGDPDSLRQKTSKGEDSVLPFLPQGSNNTPPSEIERSLFGATPPPIPLKASSSSTVDPSLVTLSPIPLGASDLRPSESSLATRPRQALPLTPPPPGRVGNGASWNTFEPIETACPVPVGVHNVEVSGDDECGDQSRQDADGHSGVANSFDYSVAQGGVNMAEDVPMRESGGPTEAMKPFLEASALLSSMSTNTTDNRTVMGGSAATIEPSPVLGVSWSELDNDRLQRLADRVCGLEVQLRGVAQPWVHPLLQSHGKLTKDHPPPPLVTTLSTNPYTDSNLLETTMKLLGGGSSFTNSA